MENIKLACIIAILAVSCYFVPKSFEHKLLPIVEGDFQPEFRDVAMAFRANMEAGREKGAAFVVYHKGEPVFDMWAGYADRQSLRRWRNNTTTMMGLLNYSKPVTDYWPEFGSHGKQNITLEMLLSHQTGTHYFEEPISLRDLNTQQARIDKPSTVFNDPELREITLSSVSVTGTARGMAKLFSILSNQGQYKGDQVLKQETLTQLLTRTVTGVCPETGFHVSYTRGLQSFTNPYGETVYGQSGYGGQVVIADPSNQLSMAYASSYLSIYEFGEDPRFTDLQSKLYTNLQRYIERQLKG
ncbi:LACT2-like protein [Mya arenaria]|uniref:LACT2-like protein n=1 Tax=Mya arenaria TaxID=6604 RepID=A0ABY7G9E9_MYAAR|nr:LACT2-like protein [Mya arenaria]